MPISRKTQLKMLWLVNNAFIMIIFTYYNELIKLTHCHPSSKIYVTTMDPLLSLNPSSLKILFPIDIDPGGWSPVTFPYIIPQIGQAGLDWNASSIHSVQNVCPHLWRFFGFFLYPCKCYRLKIFRKYLRKNEILKIKYQRITNTYI